MKALKTEGFRSTIAMYLDALSGFIGIVVFLNFLELDLIGIYYIISGIVVVAGQPIKGICTANEQYTSSNKSIFGTSLVVTLILSTVISLLLLVIYGLVSSLGINDTHIISAIILLFSYGLLEISRSTYSGLGNPANSNFIIAVRGILETALQITAVITEFGVAGMIIASATSNILTFIYITSKLQLTRISLTESYELTKYAKWSSITWTSDSVFNESDAIILGYLIDPSVAGAYSSITRFMLAISEVGNGLRNPILVYVSNDEANYEKINRISSYASLLAVPIIIGAMLIGADVLNIFNTTLVKGDLDPSRYYYLLVGSAIYYGFRSHNKVLMGLYHGLGKPRKIAIAFLITSLVRISCTITLVSLYGLNGIIASMLISIVIRYVILTYGTPYRPIHIANQIIASIPLILVVVIVDNTVLSVVLGGITYFAVIAILELLYNSTTGE